MNSQNGPTASVRRLFFWARMILSGALTFEEIKDARNWNHSRLAALQDELYKSAQSGQPAAVIFYERWREYREREHKRKVRQREKEFIESRIRQIVLYSRPVWHVQDRERKIIKPEHYSQVV